MAMCKKCRTGPKEMGGHVSLLAAQRMDAATKAVIFRCSDCETMWGRDYRGSGFFAWAQVAEPITP